MSTVHSIRHRSGEVQSFHLRSATLHILPQGLAWIWSKILASNLISPLTYIRQDHPAASAHDTKNHKLRMFTGCKTHAPRLAILNTGVLLEHCPKPRPWAFNVLSA
ncbi:hypothetical protein PsYK624_168260 [Phanerochaete sordida]|uniref:Uncharacterized protein n=1 Tax=Phanerochaete sordida TaxID=48140 RepID=A0A9P3GRI1_9APHY|nr:hypothetical protein PsYK624_168260 [Phanerochaete sordida]